MTHWADQMLAKGRESAPAPEPKPPRPPMTTGHKVAAGIILSFFAFVLVVIAASWNAPPDASVVCRDKYGSTSAYLACLDYHNAVGD